jgi:hypothetical protein
MLNDVIKIHDDSDVRVSALNYFAHTLCGEGKEQRPTRVRLPYP